MNFRNPFLATLLFCGLLCHFSPVAAESADTDTAPPTAAISAGSEPAATEFQDHNRLMDSIKHSGSQFGEEDKQKILESLDELNKGIEVDLKRDSGPEGWLIPFTGIIFSFGTPLLIVALVLLYAHRRNRQRAALISEFLRAGKDVPHELLGSSAREPASLYQRGMTFTLIGVAIALVLGFIDDWDTASLGLIPIAYGCAQLLSWRAEKPPASH